MDGVGLALTSRQHPSRSWLSGARQWRAPNRTTTGRKHEPACHRRACFALPAVHRRDVMKLLKILAAAGALAAVSTMTAAAADISGAGATFPYPIYAKWA